MGCHYCQLVSLLFCFRYMSATFIGGTASWTMDNGANFHLLTKTAWTLGSTGCSINDAMHGATTLYDEDWACIYGCSGSLVVPNKQFRCGQSSATQNWVQIQGNISFKGPPSEQFVLRLSAAVRTPLGNDLAGPWIMSTAVDLRQRNDTGRPNRPPVTAVIPVVSIPPDCMRTLTIPLYDEDEDEVRCRWATAEECGDACYNRSSSLPSGAPSQTPCTITINPTTANGFEPGLNYLVAMTIEDFPQTLVELEDGTIVNSTQPLSSVPLQFIVHVTNGTETCTDIPEIVSPTAEDGSQFIVPSGTTWTQRIYVRTNGDKVINESVISGLQDAHVTDFQSDDKGRPNTTFVDISWKQTPNLTGANVVCFAAVDTAGHSSMQRCFVLLSGYPDPCLSVPCQNNGICSISYTNFTCLCPAGLYGDVCQFDVDECSWSPCQNGGECLNTFGDYKCFCRPGYGGKNCSGTDLCLSNPCKGKGECIQDRNSYSCKCFHGYSGTVCQNDYDNCTSSLCENAGRCIDLVGGFVCECEPPYTGQYCEEEIDFCDPSPCQNNGTCQRNVHGYVCKCPDDFIGLNCELSVKQICNGDQSYCSCHVNGEPIQVPIPDPVQEEAYQRNLRAGVIGYPVGLVFGLGCCLLLHYFVIRRCTQNSSSRGGKSDISGSISSFRSSSRSTVYPFAATPPPRYSSLGVESNI